jgi:hypothetical protein
MDLNQRKLNKSEWESIEVPVSSNEHEVLQMITKGYHDINIKENKFNSIFTFLKIEYSELLEDYLFNKYLRPTIEEIIKKNKIEFIKFVKKETKKRKHPSASEGANNEGINVGEIAEKKALVEVAVGTDIQLKSADKIRVERFSDTSSIDKTSIYEFILLSHIEEIIRSRKELEIENDNKSIKSIFTFNYYTLYKLLRNNIQKINRHLIKISQGIIDLYEDDIDMSYIISNADELIEKNKSILKYSDLTLYEHQKEIYTIVKEKRPKLILYTAPTGTGKTLTPLAISEQYRVVFVCAARHVGLQLAKAAISIQKKIAFAFGCASAGDVRLHYYAAKDYTINKRGGGIGKVDNSNGEKVEIIICDIKSYIPAMYYMLSFNKEQNIYTYWDEPTITMDYDKHEFHEIIQNNWKENIIPNVILSSATLPKIHELTETIADFKVKHPTAKIHSIVSHDCKKSIPIVNKDGLVVLPHYLSEDYNEVLRIAKHCENNLTLTRYFDLKEIIDFISFIIHNGFTNSKMIIQRHFETIDDINMKSIKVYYIKLLQNINVSKWGEIYNHFMVSRVSRIPINDMVDTKGNRIIKKNSSIGPGVSKSTSSSSSSSNGNMISRINSEQQETSGATLKLTSSNNAGIYVTTKDSFTLTDGPTIFISNDVEKIAQFCIQQANIPQIVMTDIMNKIEYNNGINNKINEFEKEMEFETKKIEHTFGGSNSSSKKSTKDCKKFNRDIPEEVDSKNRIGRLVEEINLLRNMIKSAVLNDTFIPNKHHHLSKWADGLKTTSSFTSNIDEETINKIMLLHGIDDKWKILLMMGIGVFINHENIVYTEIMKRLADEQKLYMIIATSDYIYGTNYQFCHLYLSKDMNLTQEKIIQALGRVGRSNIQQTYTLRFRDDLSIMKLFTNETEKPEIINMNRLFNSNKIVWNGKTYEEVKEE